MPELDAEELFHLGLKASQKGDNDKAIIYLKESLNINEKAETYYILGAEYAQIGMYDRAIAFMQKSVEVNPELHTARFQCGLLFMVQNNPQAALNTWAELEKLGEDEALYQFATGLTQLTNDNQAAALIALEKGIRLNTTNPALSKDMQNIIDNLNNDETDSTNTDQTKTPVTPITETGKADAHNEMLIRNYGSDN